MKTIKFYDVPEETKNELKEKILSIIKLDNIKVKGHYVKSRHSQIIDGRPTRKWYCVGLEVYPAKSNALYAYIDLKKSTIAYYQRKKLINIDNF